jgi:hypothetical protein
MKHSNNKHTTSGSRSRRGAGKGDLTAEITAKVSRVLNNLNAGSMIFVRRLTNSGTIASNAAGAFPVGTLAASNAANACTDFASCANLAVAYRVKAMRVRVWPVLPFVVAGIAPPPALLCCAEFSSGLSTASYANMLDSAACRFFSGFKPATFTTDWGKLLDAKLWTPTNAAIASSETYGIVYIGATGLPASQVTTVYFAYVVEYETEFITSA